MRRILALAFVLAAAAAQAQAPRSLSDADFAALSARLSEQSGYFDTDNVISNEDSYLHALTLLKKSGTTGGVYVGVGPDQNFSYIAALRPHAAIIVDIRRDNLLEHALFKAIFSLARNRMEYLALLFGRASPRDTAGWSAKPADSLFAWLDRARPDSATAVRARAGVVLAVAEHGFHLGSADIATVQRFHQAFISGGPALRFNTFGRAPSANYPDFRQLALELDRDGKPGSFLATEAAFQAVKDLEARNLVIPVVGNFAGTHALHEIGVWMTAQHETLSAFYASNVEQYLIRDGGFDQFAKNIAGLPHDPHSAIIRSCFQCRGHAQQVNGYYTVQLVQLVDRFAALYSGAPSALYRDLVTVGLVQP